MAVDAFASISMFLPADASFPSVAKSWFKEPLVPVEPSADRVQPGLLPSRAVVVPGPCWVKEPLEILAVTEARRTFIRTITNDCKWGRDAF